MICVAIGRGRHKHMMAEHRHLAEQGIELVELRLDYITNREVNLKRLLRERPCPVIVTARREMDGGKWQKSEEDRIVLLRSAIAEGVDYIDIEEDIADQIPRFGKTKRIISLHDFEKTPDDLPAIHDRISKMDPDIVKIATMAHSPSDNLRMLDLMVNPKVSTVGMCMGEVGTPTRILAAKYGAPYTYATFHHERSLAPGQLSYRVMREVYDYESINSETEIFGVIGDPIGHSLSPVVHNSAFRELGMNRVYLPFRVPARDLDQFITDCPKIGIRGLSVTIPHKESVLKHCTRVDGAVRGIGAVNTLVFGDDGSVVGYNTDYRAAMASLDEKLGTDKRQKPMAGHTALVLGSGGAARALAFGLKRRGAAVVIAGRTLSRAQKLAEDLDCRAISWDQRYHAKAEVIVNATPVGMHPNVNDTPYEKSHLKPSMLVFDTVYNPEQTLLFKEARDRRCRVISGMEMFVGQAALQFNLFTNQEPPIDVMHNAVRRAIGAARY